MRADVAADRIGPNIAEYSRKLSRMHALHPPSAERIRNFVSQLKRAQALGDEASQ
ncbi:MAG: hypothetical protein JHD35_02870 [Sphingopyxis sp.]|nr:hypothetical protein [Sphingopyxis sp.]